MAVSDFLLSVAASLIAALFVPLFIQLWEIQIIPWWQNRTYRGKKIDGCWHALAEYPHNGKKVIEEEKVKLVQNGHSVRGYFTSKNSGEFTVYEFEGNFLNATLTASYWLKSKDDSYDRGTITLKLLDDKSLIGSFTYFEGSDILIGDYKWGR
jgi:hypothetical protein